MQHWINEVIDAVAALNERLFVGKSRIPEAPTQENIEDYPDIIFEMTFDGDVATIKFGELIVWDSDYDERVKWDEIGDELPADKVESIEDYVWRVTAKTVRTLHTILNKDEQEKITLLKINCGTPSIVAPGDHGFERWTMREAIVWAWCELHGTEGIHEDEFEEVKRNFDTCGALREGDVEFWIL
jgi:hypothetical protein